MKWLLLLLLVPLTGAAAEIEVLKDAAGDAEGVRAPDLTRIWLTGDADQHQLIFQFVNLEIGQGFAGELTWDVYHPFSNEQLERRGLRLTYNDVHQAWTEIVMAGSWQEGQSGPLVANGNQLIAERPPLTSGGWEVLRNIQFVSSDSLQNPADRAEGRVPFTGPGTSTGDLGWLQFGPTQPHWLLEDTQPAHVAIADVQAFGVQQYGAGVRAWVKLADLSLLDFEMCDWHVFFSVDDLEGMRFNGFFSMTASRQGVPSAHFGTQAVVADKETTVPGNVVVDVANATIGMTLEGVQWPHPNFENALVTTTAACGEEEEQVVYGLPSGPAALVSAEMVFLLSVLSLGFVVAVVAILARQRT